MGSRGSTRLAVILLVCLAVSGLAGCYKRYVRAHVPRCPPMNEAMLAEMLIVTDSPTVDYTADETIPYCAGIDALLE
jgi:hypothetical protein